VKDGICEAVNSSEATITINPLPVPNPSNDSPVCIYGTLNLSSVSGMTTYLWNGPNSFSSSLQNPSISNVSTATEGTYTITVTDANGCSASATTSVTLHPQPAKPVISPMNAQVCEQGGISSVVLIAICPGNTVKWTGELSGSAITVSPTMTKSYRAVCVSPLGCSSDSSDAAVVNVIPKPTKPVITPSSLSICAGDIIRLTASSCDGDYGTLTWTGGLTGTSIVVTPTNTTSYSVVCKTLFGCESDASDATVITVVPVPTNPIVTNPVISSGTNITLTATCASGTAVWYSALNGGSALGMGTFMTPNLMVNTTYYVACESSPCTSDRLPQTVQIDVFSIVNQPNNAVICSGQNAVFAVGATGVSITYQWQENTGSGWVNVTDGGVYSGAMTASLSITAPPTMMNGYQYRCIMTNGVLNGTPASLTTDAKVLSIFVSALANNLIVGTSYNNFNTIFQAVQTITATNGITGTSRIDYFAGNSISLNPGFAVTPASGSSFIAKIQTPCTNTNTPIPDVLKK
jgi:hypothetical protein